MSSSDSPSNSFVSLPQILSLFIFALLFISHNLACSIPDKPNTIPVAKMKLLSLLFVSSTLAVSAFGVTPNPSVTKSVQPNVGVKPVAFRKNSAVNSPLFRDPASMARGGAVPGWDAYTKALDTNPLTAKALTSLVGWALGDFLAQVRNDHDKRVVIRTLL
jgi:hypothetical protein